jgi:hypothetical protein
MITYREKGSSGLNTTYSLLRRDPGERGANKEVGNARLISTHISTPIYSKGTPDYDPDSEVRQAGAGIPPAECELQCRKKPLRCCLLGDAVGLELHYQIRPSVEVTYEQAQED